MRGITLFLAVAAASSALACATRRYSPVEVSAVDFDVSPLFGRWEGEYHSEETGRSGAITFTLQPGEASAYGDVMMIPRTPTRSIVPMNNQTVGVPALGTVRELLTIHFSRFGDGLWVRTHRGCADFEEFVFRKPIALGAGG